jgi:hypothetical protein
MTRLVVGLLWSDWKPASYGDRLYKPKRPAKAFTSLSR